MGVSAHVPESFRGQNDFNHELAVSGDRKIDPTELDERSFKDKSACAWGLSQTAKGDWAILPCNPTDLASSAISFGWRSGPPRPPACWQKYPQPGRTCGTCLRRALRPAWVEPRERAATIDAGACACAADGSCGATATHVHVASAPANQRGKRAMIAQSHRWSQRVREVTSHVCGIINRVVAQEWTGGRAS
jgi:hypothetical protein